MSLDASRNTLLDDIGGIIGFTPTTTLSGVFGGRYLWVPQEAAIGHPLDRMIGAPAFRALVKEFGGQRIYVPALPAIYWARYWDVSAQLIAGRAPKDIAASTGMSRRRIEQLAGELQQVPGSVGVPVEGALT